MRTFSVPGTDMRLIKEMGSVTNMRLIKEMGSIRFSCRSLMNAQIRTYTDIAHVFGMFWQKSNPDIDHWNGIKKVLLFCKELKASY